MSIRITQNSFSKGIISPILDSRYDLEQYSKGVKELINGIVLQEGCIVNRAGLEFCVETKNNDKKCRLIPFEASGNNSAIIELGEKYIRIIKDGGYIITTSGSIVEIETPYLEDDLFEIDYVQQADVVTFVHKNYTPRELIKNSWTDWSLKAIDYKPKISPPKTVNAVYTGSTSSNTKTYSYVVCAVDKEYNEESERSSVVSVKGHREANWTTSEYITISWSTVVGAKEYNVYRNVNGLYGYVGTSSNLSFIDNNIEPDLSSCAPISKNPFENQNPSCVCYYQQRKVYACSDKNPQEIWASQSGTNDNFNISRPLNSTDALDLTLYDNIASPINHLIPLEDLIVMTNNAEWSVNGSDGVFCANPTPVANLQSYYGSSKIKPAISGPMVLYVQSGNNIVRDLGYDYLSDAYDGQELTILASHLFSGKQIVDMSYSKEPYRILWCIMSDGTINGLTYNPKQKICAWHIHKTRGDFESCTTIRENNEDIVYFVIKRTINNETRRFIERMKSREISDFQDGFFLDCARKFETDVEIDAIGGLSNLKNEEVNAILDNSFYENLKVDEDGTVVLPIKCKNAIIGLGYEFSVTTMNLENEGSLGLKKNIHNAEVRIYKSKEEFEIKNDDGTYSENPKTLESHFNPNELFSKDVNFYLLSGPKTNANITLRQKKPYPICISAITTNFSIEEIETK